MLLTIYVSVVVASYKLPADHPVLNDVPRLQNINIWAQVQQDCVTY